MSHCWVLCQCDSVGLGRSCLGVGALALLARSWAHPPPGPVCLLACAPPTQKCPPPSTPSLPPSFPLHPFPVPALAGTEDSQGGCTKAGAAGSAPTGCISANVRVPLVSHTSGGKV